MNIYKFLPENDVVDVKMVKGVDYDPLQPKLYMWEKQPLNNVWKPVEVSLEDVDHRGRTLRRTDFLGGSYSHFIVDDKVRGVLFPIVQNYGEFLPLASKNEKLWIFNVTNIIDAIDFDASELMFPSESVDYAHPNLAKMVLNKKKVGDNLLFRLPQKNIYPTYFTQGFIEIIEKTNLTGFTYAKVATAI